MSPDFPQNPDRKRVLVVDDERAIADTLALILRSAGYETAAIYSGSAAAEFAPQFAPDLIISDIQMPGIDGVDASASILKQMPGCRIVLFSGYPQAHAARAEALGLEILPKPLAPEFLIQRVQRELQPKARSCSA